MTAPAPGLTMAGGSQTFGWSASSGASQYQLNVGSSVGGTDLYNQSTGTNLSAAVSNLPTDGRILYVRLWYLSGTTWLSNDFVYFAAK
jgi:serine protease